MDAASGAGVPVVVVRHSEPAESGVFVPGSEGWQLHDVVTSRPHDALFEKSLPGSFTGTGLEGWLAERGVDTVVIAGYLTHMCVDMRTRLVDGPNGQGIPEIAICRLRFSPGTRSVMPRRTPGAIALPRTRNSTWD